MQEGLQVQVQSDEAHEVRVRPRAQVQLPEVPLQGQTESLRPQALHLETREFPVLNGLYDKKKGCERVILFGLFASASFLLAKINSQGDSQIEHKITITRLGYI